MAIYKIMYYFTLINGTNLITKGYQEYCTHFDLAHEISFAESKHVWQIAREVLAAEIALGHKNPPVHFMLFPRFFVISIKMHLPNSFRGQYYACNRSLTSLQKRELVKTLGKSRFFLQQPGLYLQCHPCRGCIQAGIDHQCFSACYKPLVEFIQSCIDGAC